MKGKLKRAGCDDTFLIHLLAQFNKTQMRKSWEKEWMTLHGGDATEADIRLWCCQYLAPVVKGPAGRIDQDADFTALGVDSAEMLFMVSALESQFGLDLASDTTLKHPSVGALARFVSGLLETKRRRA